MNDRLLFFPTLTDPVHSHAETRGGSREVEAEEGGGAEPPTSYELEKNVELSGRLRGRGKMVRRGGIEGEVLLQKCDQNASVFFPVR